MKLIERMLMSKNVFNGHGGTFPPCEDQLFVIKMVIPHVCFDGILHELLLPKID